MSNRKHGWVWPLGYFMCQIFLFIKCVSLFYEHGFYQLTIEKTMNILHHGCTNVGQLKLLEIMSFVKLWNNCAAGWNISLCSTNCIYQLIHFNVCNNLSISLYLPTYPFHCIYQLIHVTVSTNISISMYVPIYPFHCKYQFIHFTVSTNL